MKKNYTKLAVQVILFFLVMATARAQSPGGVGTANLKIWLKADAGISATVNGNPVPTWISQAPGALSFAADHSHGSTDPTLVTIGTNFNPAVQYTASAMHTIAISAGPLLMNSTVFFVGKQSATANDGFHAIWGASSPVTSAAETWSPYISGNNIGAFAIPNYTGHNSPLTWDTSEASFIRSRVTAASDIILSKQGSAEETLSSDILDPVNNADNRVFLLGNNIDPGADEPFGNVYETLVYNTASLTATNIQKIESYLALKYGISLNQSIPQDYLASNGTTKMWNATTGAASGFNHAIFGIGKDNTGGLDQRIAQSAEKLGGGVLTIATINDFLSANKNASRTALANLSFLTMADNNGPAAWSNTNTLTGFSYLRRQWQVQKTGSAGSTWLQFDTDNPNFDIPALKAGTKYFIIVDADGDGNYSNAVATALTHGTGGLWSTTAAITLANGSKFTLATQADGIAPGGVTSGLVVWLKANAGTGTTDDLSTVGTWIDNNNLPLQATGNPTYTANSTNYNPAVFYGASDYHELPPATIMPLLITNSTVFVAGAPSAGASADDHHAAWNSDDNSDYPLIIKANQVGHYGIAGDDEPIALLPWNDETSSFAMEQIFNNNAVAVSKEGSAAVTLSSAAVGSGNYHYLGNDGMFHGFGNIAETLVYDNTALSNTDIQKINSYFALKYGITLDNSAGGTAGNYVLSNGSTAWTANTNPNYQHHVIGIVRDNTSALLQKQSRTADDSLKIFVGSLATDNASNTAPISNNFSSLVIGDDGGSPHMSTTLPMPSTLKVRFGRKWKIVNNNFSGTFSLEIKWDSSSLVNLNNFRLLVSGTEDFSSAPTYGSPTVVFTAGSIIISNINSTLIPPGVSFITIGSTTYTLLASSTIFNANATDDNKVNLSWQTSAGSNTDYFSVERSVNGNYWETVNQGEC